MDNLIKCGKCISRNYQSSSEAPNGQTDHSHDQPKVNISTVLLLAYRTTDTRHFVYGVKYTFFFHYTALESVVEFRRRIGSVGFILFDGNENRSISYLLRKRTSKNKGGTYSAETTRTSFIEPDGQQPEYRGATDGREKAPPVVPDRKVHGGYFDAEEDAADWRPETTRHSHRARRRQHFGVPWLVLVDPFERADYFRQQRGRDAGYVYERTLNTFSNTRFYRIKQTTTRPEYPSSIFYKSTVGFTLVQYTRLLLLLFTPFYY